MVMSPYGSTLVHMAKQLIKRTVTEFKTNVLLH